MLRSNGSEGRAKAKFRELRSVENQSKRTAKPVWCVSVSHVCNQAKGCVGRETEAKASSMSSLEVAVQSGLQASQALGRRRRLPCSPYRVFRSQASPGSLNFKNVNFGPPGPPPASGLLLSTTSHVAQECHRTNRQPQARHCSTPAV